MEMFPKQDNSFKDRFLTRNSQEATANSRDDVI